MIQWFHKFTDPWGTTMVGAMWINYYFESLNYPDRWKKLSQTPPKFILSSVTASSWWLLIYIHGKMCTQKHCLVSVAFNVFFFATKIKMFMSAMQFKACLKELNRAHSCSYHHAVNLDTLDCSWCFAKNKLKNYPGLLS